MRGVSLVGVSQSEVGINSNSNSTTCVMTLLKVINLILTNQCSKQRLKREEGRTQQRWHLRHACIMHAAGRLLAFALADGTAHCTGAGNSLLTVADLTFG